MTQTISVIAVRFVRNLPFSELADPQIESMLITTLDSKTAVVCMFRRHRGKVSKTSGCRLVYLSDGSYLTRTQTLSEADSRILRGLTHTILDFVHNLFFERVESLSGTTWT